MLVSVVRNFNASGSKALIRELLDRYSAATGLHITDPIQLMYLWDKLVSEVSSDSPAVYIPAD